MKVDLDKLYPIMEGYLREGKEVTFTTTGISMMPLLRHRRDQVVLVKPEGRLKKGDLPFYRRDNGKFILHRVIGVTEDAYIMCGDGQTAAERGITDENIIGVVKGIIRDNKKISVRSIKYRMYVALWVAMLPIRRYLLWILRRIKPDEFVLD